MLTVLNPEPGRQAVVIGRFHGRELTSGQAAVLTTAAKLFPDYPVVVFLGCARNRTTKRNPLPFESRSHIVRDVLPNAIIVPINDQEENDTWAESVDNLVRMVTTGNPILVGGRDCFIPAYVDGKGRFESRQFPPMDDSISATSQRAACGQIVVNDPVWRQGVIWGTQNQFNRVDSTVDALVFSHDLKSVLLGWKTKNPRIKKLPNGTIIYTGGVFPGGYVNKGERAEDAVKRELFEETTLSTEGKPISLGTFVVKDWRYQREVDRSILTHFYLYRGIHLGGATPNDDVLKLEWVALDLVEQTLAEHHLDMWNFYKNDILTAINDAKEGR